jgi:hypothetical protein
VYLGNMVAHFMGYGFGHLAFALRGRAEALATLNLDPESVPRIMMETYEQMQMVDALFNVAD